MRNQDMNRRTFLKNLGIGAAGLAVAGALPVVPALADGEQIPEYPWTWHPIDKQKALEYTYKRWFEVGGCRRIRLPDAVRCPGRRLRDDRLLLRTCRGRRNPQQAV